MTPLGPRNRHLIRPATPEPFNMVETDFPILAIVGRYHFATAEHAAVATDRSLVNTGRRYNAMFRAHILTRPPQQQTRLAAHAFNGAARIVYSLGRVGARLLQERGMPLRIDHTFRPTTLSHLMHALETTRFMVELTRDVARLPNVNLVDHIDLIDSFPEKTRKDPRPFSLRVTFDERGRLVTKTNTPDRLFSLQLLDSNQRLNFAYECDRGTETVEPHARTAAQKSTIHRKLSVMHRAFHDRLFLSRWNFERLRVLFETTSERRIAAMVDTERHLVSNGKLPGMVLYTSTARRAAHGPLGPIWISAAMAPLAEELRQQAVLIAREPKRRITERRKRIDRLAAIIEDLDGLSLLPTVTHAEETNRGQSTT
jgi:hypothetical protein